jgi:hypothetical protein
VSEKYMSTPAEIFLLKYKDNFFSTVLATADGLRIGARVVFLQYKPESIFVFICINKFIVGFYICCRDTHEKVTQIKNNSYVTLSFTDEKKNEASIFYCTAIITQDKSVTSKAFYSDLKDKYGYTGIYFYLKLLYLINRS